MNIKFILKHKVNIKHKQDTDKFGKPVYDVFEGVKSRIELATQYYRSDQGVDILADGIAYFDKTDRISMGDLIEDENLAQYVVVGVSEALDMRGRVHHREALINYTDKNE